MTSPLRGDEFRIHKFVADKAGWILRKVNFFKEESTRPTHILSRGDFAKHKKEALMLVHERLAHFNQFYGFSYRNVTVRNQKSRWGSCSKKGNLSFSYKILFLSPEERDYIIVHELCHLKEFNHSKKFWALVAETIPKYRQVRKSLHEHRFFYR